MLARDNSHRPAGLGKALTTTGLVAALVVIALAIASPPWSVLDKAHLVGYGICHQIPGHSYFLNGKQLPLCARCSGTYLGAVLGFVGLICAGRRRVADLPATRTILVLATFVAAMGVDGVNSYLSFFPNAPRLYEPSNVLRVTTGLLNGLALSLVVYPVFNYTLWRVTERRRSIEHLWEVPVFFVPMGLIVWGLESGAGFLLYPLAVISTGGVMVLLTMVNTMIVLILFGRESMALNWRRATPPIVAGLAVSVVELSVMIALRAILTQAVGLPL
jgi:uncharacterized membrane protein